MWNEHRFEHLLSNFSLTLNSSHTVVHHAKKSCPKVIDNYKEVHSALLCRMFTFFSVCLIITRMWLVLLISYVQRGIVLPKQDDIVIENYTTWHELVGVRWCIPFLCWTTLFFKVERVYFKRSELFVRIYCCRFLSTCLGVAYSCNRYRANDCSIPNLRQFDYRSADFTG